MHSDSQLSDAPTICLRLARSSERKTVEARLSLDAELGVVENRPRPGQRWLGGSEDDKEEDGEDEVPEARRVH